MLVTHRAVPGWSQQILRKDHELLSVHGRSHCDHHPIIYWRVCSNTAADWHLVLWETHHMSCRWKWLACLLHIYFIMMIWAAVKGSSSSQSDCSWKHLVRGSGTSQMKQISETTHSLSTNKGFGLGLTKNGKLCLCSTVNNSKCSMIHTLHFCCNALGHLELCFIDTMLLTQPNAAQVVELKQYWYCATCAIFKVCKDYFLLFIWNVWLQAAGVKTILWNEWYTAE